MHARDAGFLQRAASCSFPTGTGAQQSHPPCLQILTGSPASPTSQSVKDLTAAELQALWAAPGPSLLRRFHDHDTHQWRNGLEPWVCQEEDVPPLLADVFKAVPQGCGFDVEVKVGGARGKGGWEVVVVGGGGGIVAGRGIGRR